MKVKMTNEIFDNCLLEQKVSFRFSEAARLVLVHEIQVENAASIVGLSALDIPEVKKTIEMFIKASQR